MEAYALDWLNLLVRWLHITAGVAWIGASLYFVMLDTSLRPPQNPEDATRRGVSGELWAVHGGGFYQSQKFLTGPRGQPLSAHLHWSKWEAYTTWLSGMALLALVYWYGAQSFLIDRAVMELSVPAAIAISAGSLVAGWLVYDALCRLIRHELTLSLLVYALVVAAAWGYSQVFGGRAAYIHVGALIGTIMVWNVFFQIIPGQKKMVAEVLAGQPVDPRPGIVGKQRSVHNTYLTLPVLFIMISSHYPMTFGHRHAWAVLAVLIMAGALIRQYFVLRHSGRNAVVLPAVAIALLAMLVVMLAPAPASDAGKVAAVRITYADVQPILAARCAVCHAEKPTFPGFPQPPAGLRLETAEQTQAAAEKIRLQAIATRVMPPGNLTQITDEERQRIGDWLAAGAPAQ
ncbi:MAG: urate hydroxylase PuuD [Burkholderiales bacterium]